MVQKAARKTAAESAALDEDVRKCIEICEYCHNVCLEGAMNHCLESGGDHVKPPHLRLMLNCAEICQTAANFMLSHSDLHGRVCGICAEICEACADSCRQVGDMDECVSACQSCAQSCRQMAA